MKCLWLVLLFLYFPFVVWTERDYYETLNVDKRASQNDIKRQFRRLAKTKHPDKNKNPNAEEEFRELSEAYSVLSDVDKRQIYDKFGKAGLKDHGSHEQHGNPFFNFFGFGFDFGDSRGSDEIPRGDDVVVDIWVTLEELFVGDFVEISRVKLNKKEAKGTRKCRCRREMRTTALGPGQFQMHQVEVCDDCPNVSFYQEEHHLDLEIEPGMRDGHLYPFISEGELHIDGDPGDLKFRIRQQMHKRFVRRGDDLYTNVTLSLKDSLVGFELNITHLDGHKVTLKSETVTAPGTVFHKPGEGMPNYENSRVRGSLYVTVDVAFPSGRRLTDTERTQIISVFPGDTGSSNSDRNFRA